MSIIVPDFVWTIIESGTAFTIVAYIFSWFKKRYNDRIGRLSLIQNSIKSHRYEYSLKMRDGYKEHLEKDDNWCKDSILISRESWIRNKGPVDITNTENVFLNKSDDLKSLRKEKVKLVSWGRRRLDYLLNNYLPEDDLGPISFLKSRIKDDNSTTLSHNLRRFCGSSMFDGEIFVISSSEDRLEIDVKKSNYFSYINTCEYIANYNVARLDQGKPPVYIELLDFSNRSAVAGVCTLMIFKNLLDEEDGGNKSSYFVVHHRSGAVSVGANAVSLAPVGSFAPLNNRITGDEDIRGNILREFEEEFFNRYEIEYPEEYSIPNYFRKSENGPIEEDFVKFYYLSRGFDPLCTNMEMIFVMVMDVDHENFIKMISNNCLDYSEIAEGKVTAKGLSKLLSRTHSREGTIDCVHFRSDLLKMHSNNKMAIPVFREAMRLMSDIESSEDSSFPEDLIPVDKRKK